MITFFVPGVPVSKGSAKAFVHRTTKRVVVMQDNRDRQKPWASAITYAAAESAVQHKHKINGCGVSVALHFTMPRPRSHYGTGRNSQAVKPSAPLRHTVKPDLDKLVRTVLDALTGVLWNDDSQVTQLTAFKKYGDRPGVRVEVAYADHG